MSAAPDAPRPIPEEMLEAPVAGVNLVPGRLRDQLDDAPALLVFLRHFGCIFCRETVADLRRAVEERHGFPPVLFFFQGSSTEGRLFLRRFWPEARAVADPERRFYAGFGIERGGMRQMFGPGVWSAQRRARAKGLANGPRSGDIWMMPGLFLVHRDAVVWSHPYVHAGDAPDPDEIARRARALARPAAP